MLLGEGVFYLDVHDRQYLMGRARRIPGRNPEAIPTIHCVGQLSAVREKFRLVLSCHSIEHQPDLIGRLRDVEAVLEAGGAYAAIVPDKRYCFDRFLPESTVAEPLAALHEGRTKHTLQKIIEHYALTTHKDPSGTGKVITAANARGRRLSRPQSRNGKPVSTWMSMIGSLRLRRSAGSWLT